MELDFGYSEETTPYFKYDARVGACKLRLDKDAEPQIPYPIRMAIDIENHRMLHVCFPKDGPPQRLYYGNGISKEHKPNPIGDQLFKIGFEVYLSITDTHEALSGGRIGTLQWCANSWGATDSFRRMHTAWWEDGGWKDVAENKEDAIPVYIWKGSETQVGKKGSTNMIQFELEGWSKRSNIPGLAEAIASRPASNVEFNGGGVVTQPTPNIVNLADVPPAGVVSPQENGDDLPF